MTSLLCPYFSYSNSSPIYCVQLQFIASGKVFSRSSVLSLGVLMWLYDIISVVTSCTTLRFIFVLFTGNGPAIQAKLPVAFPVETKNDANLSIILTGMGDVHKICMKY